MNIHPTSVDKGVFAWVYKEKHLVIMICETNDLLLLTDSREFFEAVCDHLLKSFGLQIQDDDIIWYLDLRIIQSVHGISINQTEHIQALLKRYPEALQKKSKTTTPLHTDNAFNSEVAERMPASPQELTQLCKEFGASFNTTYEDLMHIMTATRLDINFTLNRLGVFQPGPSRLGFKCLRRILKYLANHVNVPLFYPNKPLESKSTFEVHFPASDKRYSITIPHCLCSHVDESLAPHKENCHSISGHIKTISTVAVDWSVKKQLGCATSTTDNETRAFYTEIKQTNRHRNFSVQIGKAIKLPTKIFSSLLSNYNLPQTIFEDPTPIFEDNKGTRDMVNAGKVTSQLKHIDLSLCYIHDSIKFGNAICRKASGHVIIADMVTKQNSGLKHAIQQNWVVGKRFYPPANSKYYQLLTSTAPLT